MLEGGLLIPLTEDGYKHISYIDSKYTNQWTVKDVEVILNNPVYSYGIHFEPKDLFLEWQYVLLYGLATLPINRYSIQQLEKVYESFLEKIKMNICYYYKVEQLLFERDNFLKIFNIGIKQIRAYLRGKEEAGISKNIIFLMKNRYAFLPVIYNFLAEFFPQEVDNRLAKLEFNIEDFTLLLDKTTHEKVPHKKGLLMEEVARYFISCIKGLKCTGHRIRGEREEVDLYFCNVSYDPFLWELGTLISVECKNWNKKFTVSDVRNLIPVMDSRGIKTCVIF